MPNIKRIHKNITIKGRVQGVGFRFTARTMALSLGVKGFVKNLYNGDVYIEAEGTQIQLQHFIAWCYRGPNYANIEDVILEEGELKDFKYFDITH